MAWSGSCHLHCPTRDTDRSRRHSHSRSPRKQCALSQVLFLALLFSFMTTEAADTKSIVEKISFLSNDHTNYRGDDSVEKNCGNTNRYNGLECWLWNLKVAIPDEKFKQNFLSISVKNMVCTKFAVRSLSSSWTPSSKVRENKNSTNHGGKTPSLHLGASGITASCHGQFQSGFLGGTVVVSVSDSAADFFTSTSSSSPPSESLTDKETPVQLSIDIHSAPLTINGTSSEIKTNFSAASYGNITYCLTNLQVENIQFSGSISSEIIKLFSKPISSFVTSFLQTDSCDLIKTVSEPFIQKGIGLANYYIGKWIEYGYQRNQDDDSILNVAQYNKNNYQWNGADISVVGLKKEEGDGDGLVAWDADVPLLSMVLRRSNDFVSKHLDVGLIPNLVQELLAKDDPSSSVKPLHPDLECQDCGFFFRGWNGLVRHLTNHTNGIAALDLQRFYFLQNITVSVPHYGNVSLSFQNLELYGLDNVTSLGGLRPYGKNGMSSFISSKQGFYVKILMDMVVRTENAQLNPIDNTDLLQETFDLRFNASDVNFLVNGTLGLDRSGFENFTVGNFLPHKKDENLVELLVDAFRCLASKMVSSSTGLKDIVARMNLQAIHLEPVAVNTVKNGNKNEGHLEWDLDHLLNTVTDLFLSEYKTLVTEALDGLVHGPLRSFLNEQIDSAITRTSSSIGEEHMEGSVCMKPNVSITTEKRYLPLDTLPIVTLLNKTVNKEAFVSGLNDFVRCAVSYVNQSGVLVGTFRDIEFAGFRIELQNLRIENLDSVKKLDLLNPEVDSFHLFNHIRLGDCKNNSGTTAFYDSTCRPMIVAFRAVFHHDAIGFVGDLNLTSTLDYLDMAGGTNIEYDLNALPGVSVPALLSYSECGAAPVTTFSFYRFEGSIGVREFEADLRMTIKDRGGSREGDEKYFQFRFGDGQQQRLRMNDMLATLFSTSVSLIQDVGNGVANMTLRDAPSACSSVKTQANRHGKSYRSMLIWNFIFLVVGGVITHTLFLVKKTIGRNPDSCSEHLRADVVGQSDGNGPIMPLLGAKEENKKNRISLEDENKIMRTHAPPRSLMFHETIHPFTRYIFPVVLIGTMILFLSSNLSIGTTVDLVITRANGSDLTFPSLFSFSLGNTIREMFKAGIYLLMLLILVFSGIWPYVKLAMMLFAWVAPIPLLTHRKREKVLIWLDALGKYSLVDAFVLVLMLVSFRYNLEVEGIGSLDVYVTPKFGFYSFLLATIMSLIAGHAMLFLHRRATLQHTIPYSGRKESLRQHVYEDYKTGALIRLSRRFQFVIFFVLLLTNILLAIGVGKKCFNFEFLGLGGLLLGENRFKSYSLLSLGSSIAESVENPSSLGIKWIQVTYFFFSFIMPFTCLGMMLLIFNVPMQLRSLRVSFMIVEIARAWGAVDVFLLSVVAALLELSQFAKFIVGDKCGFIDSFLSTWFDQELHGNAVCYDVKATIGGSSWYLFAAVVLNSCVTFVLLRFAHQAIDERIEREGQPKDNRNVMENAEREPKNTLVTTMRCGYLGVFMFEECSDEVTPDEYSLLHQNSTDAAGNDSREENILNSTS